MTTTVRTRIAQIALKQETTAGTDAIAGTPSAGDYVTCAFSIRLAQDQTPNPVENGAYDDSPPIPGGLRAEVTLTLPVIGSGAAATAPEWGKLMAACRYVETVTAAAIGAPTAATAGTTTTATAAAPFAATAQAYRGMPILLTGNPAAGATDVVLDYTAGRVISLSRTYATLTTSTLLQVPANVLYSPSSDETLEKSLTIYAFQDGLRHKIVGAKGSWGIALTAAKPAMMTFRFTGIVSAFNEAVAVPAGYTPVTRQPPRWAGGVSQLARNAAGCQSCGFDAGIRTAYPDNPEGAEGWDPVIITGAGPRFTLDPYSHTTYTPSRFTAFRAGTAVPFSAIWGSTAGNRFALSTPSAMFVDLSPSERTELGVDAIALMPDQANATAFLAQF